MKSTTNNPKQPPTPVIVMERKPSRQSMENYPSKFPETGRHLLSSKYFLNVAGFLKG